MIRYPNLAVASRIAAEEDGAACAIAGGPLRWSRDALDRRAAAVARSLVSTGAGPGSRVALIARPSALAVAALHGIARAGAVAAPIAPGLTEAEITDAAEIV